MDNRLDKIQNWVADCLLSKPGDNQATGASDARRLLASWTSIAGDASLRQYFRVKGGQQDYIVMDASSELENMEAFCRIAELMRQGSIRTPKIYASDLKSGFLLLEDFGDDRLKNYLQAENGQMLFDRILVVLNQLATCSTDNLPTYSSAKLATELNLFVEWYLGKHCAYALSSDEKSLWHLLSTQLIDSATSQQQIVVHRDFHSCNLHVLSDGDTGVIDFQDAVVGPITYDLVSWVWDRYITWSREDIEAWMEQARKELAPNITPSQWMLACDFMGLQRNLKIVGIFARLYYRDGKQGYLELLPQFVSAINDVVLRHKELEFIVPTMQCWLDLPPSLQAHQGSNV